MITGFVVEPRSKKQIEDIIWVLREFMDCKKGKLDIPKTLDRLFEQTKGFIDYEVISDTEFIQRHCNGNPHVEAYVCQRNRVIYVKESVFNGALGGEARMIFTLAHELGHFILHLDEPLLTRYNREIHEKLFRDSEWQANYFAGSLLAPATLILETMSIDTIMKEFCLSKQAAEVRFQQVFGYKK